MNCPTCGSENVPTARFCNMCGLSFLGENLDQTQRGLGTQPPSRASASEVTMAWTPGPLPSESAVSNSTPGFAKPVVVHDAPSADPEAPLRQAPALSLTSSGALPRDPAVEGPAFDPSLSIALEKMGIRTPGQTWGLLATVAGVLVAVGAVGAYFAMRGEPDAGHARAGDPFVIGAPTAEVDYVTGSADPNTARLPDTPGTPAPSAVPAPRTAGAPAPPPPGSPNLTPTVTAGGNPVEARPSPATDAPGTPQPTADPVQPATPPVTPTPSETPAADPATPPAASELDLEMYAARVRYLVRRYHAGAVGHCFDEATARTESLSGQVVLAMHIAADGSVESASVQRNTTGDDALGSCLVSLARGWSVAPPPGGDATLSFPFSR